MNGIGENCVMDMEMVEERGTEALVIPDTRVVAVMFKETVNAKTKAPQLKGSFRGYDREGKAIFVSIISSRDSEQKPADGEIWVCEIDVSSHLARWVHKERDGSVTDSILVVGLPICKIGVPEEIRFGDVNQRGQVNYRVRDFLPDGKSKVMFVPDKNGIEPQRGELWRVSPGMILRTIGAGDGWDTIIITVRCETRVVQGVTTSIGQKWAGVTTWSPGQKKK